jgi:hypothetical protein
MDTTRANVDHSRETSLVMLSPNRGMRPCITAIYYSGQAPACKVPYDGRRGGWSEESPHRDERLFTGGAALIIPFGPP